MWWQAVTPARIVYWREPDRMLYARLHVLVAFVHSLQGCTDAHPCMQRSNTSTYAHVLLMHACLDPCFQRHAHSIRRLPYGPGGVSSVWAPTCNALCWAQYAMLSAIACPTALEGHRIGGLCSARLEGRIGLDGRRTRRGRGRRRTIGEVGAGHRRGHQDEDEDDPP